MTTGDSPFFSPLVKHVIAGNNHVFASGVVLLFFTMKYLKDMKFFFFIIFMAFTVIITHATFSHIRILKFPLDILRSSMYIIP